MTAARSERVTFTNSRGQQLVGVLDGEVGEAVAISCHGMLSNKDGDKHRMLAAELQAAGMALLRFDFAGRGESDGELRAMTYSNEVQDLYAAIEYLASRGAQRFAVFGSSMGGTVALLAASREERIVAVATLAAVGHPEEIDERYGRAVAGWRDRGYIELEEGPLDVTFLDDALTHNVVSAVGILRAPVFVLHGEDDDVVPVADAHDIASAARNARLEIVGGADHRFSNPLHLRPAIKEIASFLVQNLA